MDDILIIDMLFSRDETALKHLSDKYAPLYKSVIRGALSDESDVEECEDDLLLAVWNSIPPERPKNLRAYLCTLARRISIDKLKYNTRKKRSRDHTVMLSELEDCVPSPALAVSDSGSEALSEVLNGFLREIDPETRILFIRRYVYLESSKSLAMRFGISENSVNVKLWRARKKLKKLLETEGIYL